MSPLFTLFEENRKEIDLLVLIQSKMDGIIDMITDYMEQGHSIHESEELALNNIFMDDELVNYIHTMISSDKQDMFKHKPVEIGMYDWFKLLTTKNILH